MDQLTYERRTFVRFLCSDLLHVRISGPVTETIGLSAIVEDISRSGACLLVEEDVATGSRVAFDVDGQRYSGRVVCQSEREDGVHRLGLAFDDILWSEDYDWPECRFNPADARLSVH